MSSGKVQFSIVRLHWVNTYDIFCQQTRTNVYKTMVDVHKDALKQKAATYRWVTARRV